jgi:hypothetical protein
MDQLNKEKLLESIPNLRPILLKQIHQLRLEVRIIIRETKSCKIIDRATGSSHAAALRKGRKIIDLIVWRIFCGFFFEILRCFFLSIEIEGKNVLALFVLPLNK